MLKPIEIISIDAKPRAHSDSMTIKFKKETVDANNNRETTGFRMYLLQEDFTSVEFFRFLTDADGVAKVMSWTSGPKNFGQFRHMLHC